MHVIQTFPKFDHRLRSLNVIPNRNASDSDGHEDQAKSEKRIDLADYLVDRKESRKEVVNQNYDRENLRPVSSSVAHEHSRRRTGSSDSSASSLSQHEGKKPGRADHEDYSDHNEKNNAEQPHNLKHETAKIFSRYL